MHLKINDIEIKDYDQFDDLLGRKNEIENLTPIILNAAAPLVLTIDAPWGAGKTTFVKLWQSYLKSTEQQSIYFNAWETDYAEDPLIVLISELDKWVSENIEESRLSGWRENIKKTLPGIAKRSLIAAVKAATLGSLEIDKQIEGVASDLLGGITGDLLESFNKQTKAIAEFKETIKEILNTLGRQKNLVIFIDELDRCRPTYAIELLERIKHLFDIDRLVFILSIDSYQLSHSIRAVYGNEFDAKRYLQRFIDLDYSLKKPDNDNYINSQITSLGIEKYFSDKQAAILCKELAACYVLLSKRFDLKLRDINILLTRTRLILYAIPSVHDVHVPLLASLLLLREHNKDLYEKYASDPRLARLVIDFISDKLTIEERQDIPFCLIAGYIIATHHAFDYKTSFKDLKFHYNQIMNTEVEDRGAKSAAYKIIETADRRIPHTPTIEKIELLHRINI